MFKMSSITMSLPRQATFEVSDCQTGAVDVYSNVSRCLTVRRGQYLTFKPFPMPPIMPRRAKLVSQVCPEELDQQCLTYVRRSYEGLHKQ